MNKDQKVFKDIVPGVSLERIPEGVPLMQATVQLRGVGGIDLYFVMVVDSIPKFADDFADEAYRDNFLVKLNETVGGKDLTERVRYINFIGHDDLATAVRLRLGTNMFVVCQ
jgi:hypothetical protein